MSNQLIKRSRSHMQQIKPIMLYLDDVERIYNIIRDVSEDVTLKTDEYEMQDPAQLREIGKEAVRDFEITSYRPHISLSLTSSSGSLYCGDDNPATFGAFVKVKTVLAQRQLPLSWLTHNFFLTGMLLNLTVAFLSFVKVHSQIFAIILFAMPVLLAILWGCSIYASTKMHSLVILKYRKDETSFAKRNMDTIVVAIITAVIGGIFTYIATVAAQPNP